MKLPHIIGFLDVGTVGFLAVGTVGAIAEAPNATRATDSVSKLREWWCATHAEQALCRRQALLLRLSQTPPSAQATVLQQLRNLSFAGGAKEYSAAKAAYCSRKESAQFTICKEPVHRISRLGGDDQSLEQMLGWLCSNVSTLSNSQRDLCRREELKKKLHEKATDPAATHALLKQLRVIPYNSLTYQGVTAEWCNAGKNMVTMVCIRAPACRPDHPWLSPSCLPRV